MTTKRKSFFRPEHMARIEWPPGSPGERIVREYRAQQAAQAEQQLQKAHEHQPQLAPAPCPGDVLALVGMTTTDADRLAGYFELARRHGYATDDAEHIAGLLQMRDRTGLDMGLCIECDHLHGRRCAAARSLKAAPDWMPVRHELVRCPLRKPIKD